MSAWETVPAADDRDWLLMTNTEREEYLADVYDEITGDRQERRFHDTNGYLAHDAGSPECLALGHRPDEAGDWDEDTHPEGWGGEPLCEATQYATACTACEGECVLEDVPVLWHQPGVMAKAA